jgi:hypothetical protein
MLTVYLNITIGMCTTLVQWDGAPCTERMRWHYRAVHCVGTTGWSILNVYVNISIGATALLILTCMLMSTSAVHCVSTTHAW